MKIRNYALFAISIVSILATTHAGVSTRITLHRAPALDSPDRAGYRPSAMMGIELGVPIGTGATAFTPLPDNYVASASDIVTYQNSRPRLEAGLDIVSSTPISLSRLAYRVRSSDTSTEKPNGTISFEGTIDGTYTTTRHGILYGNDGQKGTSDDPQRLMSGSASTSVQEVVYMGFGIFYNTPTAADAENVRKYVTEKNLAVTFEYLLDGIVVASKTLRFTPAQVPPSPVIESFTSTSSTVLLGDPTMLGWTILHATLVTVTPDIGAGTLGLGGAYYVYPKGPTTYTLTATGPGGTVSKTVHVGVVVPHQTTSLATSLGASPNSIRAGENFALTWFVSPGATNITIVPDIGVVGTASGTRTLTPKATTRYTITATGPGFITGTASLEVVVVQPLPSITFEVVPSANIVSGKEVAIGWNTTGATNLFIVGIGNNNALSGNLKIFPKETTSHTFIVTGPGGVTTSTVTITVLPSPTPPPAPVFSVAMSGITPSGDVRPGTPLTLRGSVENKGANALTVTNVFVQSSVNGTNNWANWAQVGSFTLSPNTTRNVEHLWTSGPADPGTTWHFRLAGSIEGVAFVTASVSVRVVPEAAQRPISLSINREGTSVKIQVKAPPGIYYIEDASQLTGPWLRGGEAITVTEGKIPEILYTRADRLNGFFRVVHLP